MKFPFSFKGSKLCIIKISAGTSLKYRLAVDLNANYSDSYIFLGYHIASYFIVYKEDTDFSEGPST